MSFEQADFDAPSVPASQLESSEDEEADPESSFEKQVQEMGEDEVKVDVSESDRQKTADLAVQRRAVSEELHDVRERLVQAKRIQSIATVSHVLNSLICHVLNDSVELVTLQLSHEDVDETIDELQRRSVRLSIDLQGLSILLRNTRGFSDSENEDQDELPSEGSAPASQTLQTPGASPAAPSCCVVCTKPFGGRPYYPMPEGPTCGQCRIKNQPSCRECTEPLYGPFYRRGDATFCPTCFRTTQFSAQTAASRGQLEGDSAFDMGAASATASTPPDAHFVPAVEPVATYLDAEVEGAEQEVIARGSAVCLQTTIGSERECADQEGEQGRDESSFKRKEGAEAGEQEQDVFAVAKLPSTPVSLACVCVCVCVRERERERARAHEREKAAERGGEKERERETLQSHSDSSSSYTTRNPVTASKHIYDRPCQAPSKPLSSARPTLPGTRTRVNPLPLHLPLPPPPPPGRVSCPDWKLRRRRRRCWQRQRLCRAATLGQSDRTFHLT